MRKILLGTAALLAIGVGQHAPAFAGPSNEPPPAGAILDLNGQTINHGAPVEESVNFSATSALTDVTFAFREDPAFIFFSSASLVDNTTPSGNLLSQGSFTGGTLAPWTYDNVYGASFGGVVNSPCTPPGGNFAVATACWDDGAVQAYDAIDQHVVTTVGHTYTLSFFYTDNGGLSTFSDLSTNGDVSDTGGNGADILAYAGVGLPPPGTIPEPASLSLLGAALAGLGAVRRRRKGK